MAAVCRSRHGRGFIGREVSRDYRDVAVPGYHGGRSGILGVALTRIGISATLALTGHVVRHVHAVVEGLSYQFQNAHVDSHMFRSLF